MTKKHLAEMELMDIAQGILADRERIVKNISVLWKLAEEKAISETEYKKQYAVAVERLRAEGEPATIIRDLAEGKVSEIKFRAELSAAQFRASLAALEALQTSMQALQSVLKHLEKV